MIIMYAIVFSGYTCICLSALDSDVHIELHQENDAIRHDNTQHDLSCMHVYAMLYM
jgi:hypothetical protein